MLSRRAKHAFYLMAGPFMALNGIRIRYVSKLARIITDEKKKLHLGPGQRNYIDGWINVDANIFTGKCDIWADLRNNLPFRDGSVDYVYSHHVVEHLPRIESHFKDIYRVLKPGGVYRVGGPNGDSAIKKFVEGDLSWFGDWPDSYESLGGRFVNFIFCRNEHLTILTESYLQEVAKRAGFLAGTVKLPTKETDYPEIFSVCMEKERQEESSAPRTLIMEFRK